MNGPEKQNRTAVILGLLLLVLPLLVWGLWVSGVRRPCGSRGLYVGFPLVTSRPSPEERGCSR